MEHSSNFALDQQRLLEERLQEGARLRDYHRNRAYFYQGLNKWLGVLAIVLSAILSASFLSTFFAGLEILADVVVRAIASALAVLSAVIAGVQTFYKSPEKAKQHRGAAASYANLVRDIERFLASSPSDATENIDTYLEQVDQRLAELEQGGASEGRSQPA
jgi:hypothetical protein